MDVLELPRPVINFLRTMSKEMHRYSLCWDIYGGSESVTLTLTWKLQASASAGNEIPANGSDQTDVDEAVTSPSAPPNVAASDSAANFNSLMDHYTKRQTGNDILPGFISDSGAISTNTPSSKKRIGCGKLPLAKCGGGSSKQQQLQHGKLDDLASRNIAQMNGSGGRLAQPPRNLSAESRLKSSGGGGGGYQSTAYTPPSNKFDTYNFADMGNSLENDDSDEFAPKNGGYHSHQSRRQVISNVQQTYPTGRGADVCLDCPKCNNNVNNQFENHRSSRKQQQQQQAESGNSKLGSLANQFNKKVNRMVRGKSLESRENYESGNESSQFVYPHDRGGGADGMRWHEQAPHAAVYHQPKQPPPLAFNSTNTYTDHHHNHHQSKCHHTNRHRPNNNMANNYQNFEATIPISIQGKSTGGEHHTTDLESNTSAYFASPACNYADLENLPPSSVAASSSSGPVSTLTSTAGSSGGTGGGSSQAMRQQQQQPVANPWIRRNYGQTQQQQPPPPTESYHSIHISSNNKQQPEPIEISKKSGGKSTTTGDNSGSGAGMVCETSLFNRVERENILSIVESSTSSLSRQDANSSSNPSYFYSSLQATNQSNNGGNGNNSANSNNKVTFDPNLEYI